MLFHTNEKKRMNIGKIPEGTNVFARFFFPFFCEIISFEWMCVRKALCERFLVSLGFRFCHFFVHPFRHWKLIFMIILWIVTSESIDHHLNEWVYCQYAVTVDFILHKMDFFLFNNMMLITLFDYWNYFGRMTFDGTLISRFTHSKWF